LTSKTGVGTIAAIAVSVVWGLSFVAARVALTTLTPLLLATLRFAIASLVFTPVIISAVRRGILTLLDLRELALLGLLSITVYFYLQYTGVKYAGAGISALLVVGLIPVLTGVASMVLLREKFGIEKQFGIGLGLLGVAFIALPKLILGDVDVLFYLGVGSLLADSLLFALYSTMSRRIVNRLNTPIVVTAYPMVMGTLALIPLSVTSDWTLIRALTFDQWLSILYLSLVCSCLGYFLWSFALSKLEAVNAAVWLYLEPVAAFIGEAIIFGTMPTPATLIGGGFIVIGAILTNRRG